MPRTSLPSVHPFQEPIPSWDPIIPKAYEGPSMPWAHPCSGSIHPEGPWGPTMHRAQSCRRHIPCSGPIHPEGPWWTIHAQSEGTSQPRVHPCRGAMQPLLCPGPILSRGPIHAQVLSRPRAIPALNISILRAHGGQTMPRNHPCRGPTVHPSQGPTEALPCPESIHSHISCIPLDYGGPSMPRSHPCQRPIRAHCPSVPRAHGPHPCSEPIHAKNIDPCPAPNHPDDPCGPIHAQGRSMPKAHPCLGLIHLKGRRKLIHTQGPSM